MKYSINDPEYKRSNSENSTKKDKRNQISPTNSDILIPISLQPDVEDLRYLKLLLNLIKISFLKEPQNFLKTF